MIRKDIGDRAFKHVMMGLAALIVIIAAGLFIELVKTSWDSIRQFGLTFLISSKWDPVADEYGALPFIFGTMVSSFFALLLAVPIGVGAAIYLAEYAPWWMRNTISLLIDLLAAIPSVIYGLWGIFVLVPLMRSTVQPFLGKYFGFLPIFKGTPYGVGMLTASIILAIMILPFIISISREVIRAVPSVYKEASYAMGATRWEVIFSVILGQGKSGIIGGIMLALGRALGETMAVTMVIGNTAKISASLFSPGYTLASVIANEFAEAATPRYVSALIEVGLILFMVSISVNIIARSMIWSLAKGPGFLKKPTPRVVKV